MYIKVIADASPIGFGAVLCQTHPKDKNDKRNVFFASRMLTDVERRYSQCEKEALTSVWSCEQYWLYLMGKPFKLVTDNRAETLILLNTKSKPPARIERMAVRLSQFYHEIEHRPGVSNIADYYSRHTDKASPSAFLEEIKTEEYINLVT